MSAGGEGRARLPKGVAALPRPRGGRGYRASVRHGKGPAVHLGLYESPWHAAFAVEAASRALGRERAGVEVPRADQPDAEAVRTIQARVRRRLGLAPEPGTKGLLAGTPPEPDDLVTLFEVTVVGFWRGQAASADGGGPPESALDAAAGRLVDAARLLFWSRARGHPDPSEVLTDLLALRLDRAFGRADLTAEVLLDDGDDDRRVARWLAYPDAVPGRRYRGFRDEVRHLYAESFGADPGSDPSAPAPTWAVALGLAPPFTPARVRAAYRDRARTAHPDGGGTEAEFVRLRAAYEAALGDLGGQ